MSALAKDIAAFSPKSAPVQSISATGRVTRVSENFAYVRSSKYGGIFVPPAAVLPKDDVVNPDLTVHLKSGDIAHFCAVPQKGKNDCNFLATKVVVSKSSEQNQQEFSGFSNGGDVSNSQGRISIIESDCYNDKIGIITTVNETFGYILSEETLEMVFFPGSAYLQQEGEPNRLNAVFLPNDLVIFSARRQPEMNGCCWIAESVTKFLKGGETSFENQLGDFMDNFEPGNQFQSLPRPPISESGFVINLAPFYGFIQSENLGWVYFNILSWIGDTKHGFAENLTDVLSVGDEVLFCAVPQNLENGCVWRTTKVWKTTDDICRSEKSTQAFLLHPNSAKAVCNTKATQTVISVDNLLFRALKSDANLYQECVKKFPHLLRYANEAEK